MKTPRDIYFKINDFVLCILSDLSNARSDSIKTESIQNNFCDLREMFSDSQTQIDLNAVLCELKTEGYVTGESGTGWRLTKKGRRHCKTLEANYQLLKDQSFEINVNKSKMGEERKYLDPPKSTLRLHFCNGNE